MITNSISFELPEDLQRIIEGAKARENLLGRSDSKVFFFENLKEIGTAYLKIAPKTNTESLKNQVDILNWLKRKIPVPEVYYYREYQGKEYLLMSEVKGKDASNHIFMHNPEMIKIVARGLKQIHEIEINECPFDQTLDVKIQNAKFNVDNNLVDEDNLQHKYKGKTARELYQMVLEKRPADEDLVFTHGDYCFPNIIIDNERLSGFIDLGRAGVADRYQDISLALRSLRCNFKFEEWVSTFLEAYGLEELDQEKLEYYILLDELF